MSHAWLPGGPPSVLRKMLGMLFRAGSLTLLLGMLNGAETIAQNPSLADRLPMVAWAGYRWGEAPSWTPEDPVELQVTDFGAVPDDGKDDLAAFEAALRQAGEEPDERWVVIRVPAGTFDLASILHLQRSRLVLRGAGKARSVLAFSTSLTGALPECVHLRKQFSFRGGLLWVEGDPLAAPESPPPAVAIDGEYAQGSRQVRVLVASAAEVERWVGRDIHLRWAGDPAWCEIVFGGPLGAELNHGNWPYMDANNRLVYEEANRITAIEADTGLVTLAKPLRLPIEKRWEVIMGRRGNELNEVGIEDLGITFPEHELRRHNDHDGYNGVFLRLVTQGWIRGIQVTNADNAIIVERTSHVTVSDCALAGQEAHHGITLRSMSASNLFSGITFGNAGYIHGFSLQDLSNGNVLEQSVFHHGAIDCHRGMPFDNLWTEIDFVRCDGGGGGAIGPFAGRRMVAWNIQVKAPPDGTEGKALSRYHRGLGLILDPEQYSQGAIVGVQGDYRRWVDGRKPWTMPPGDKGTVVMANGHVPDPVNLYRYQWQKCREDDTTRAK